MEEPNLVYVSPGVWVVEDYHESVFWHDNYYWSYRSGVWYRSSYYTSGWVRVRAVPHRVGRIHHPHRYVRYRAPRGVRTRRAPAPRVRDHRARQPGPRARPNERVPARRARPASHRSRPAARDYRGGRSRPPAHRQPRTHKSNVKAKKRKSSKKKSKSKKKRDHR